MPDFFRCPYCVEGLGFKVMIAQAERNGYACARCGHFVRPQDQLFLCTCVKWRKWRERLRVLCTEDDVA